MFKPTVPMTEALTPDQCRVMEWALGVVVKAWDEGQRDPWKVLKAIREQGLAKVS